MGGSCYLTKKILTASQEMLFLFSGLLATCAMFPPVYEMFVLFARRIDRCQYSYEKLVLFAERWIDVSVCPFPHEMLVLFVGTFIDVIVYPLSQEMQISFPRLFDR